MYCASIKICCHLQTNNKRLKSTKGLDSPWLRVIHFSTINYACMKIKERKKSNNQIHIYLGNRHNVQKDDKIMFPHATCMCVSTAQKSGQTLKPEVFQNHHHHHHHHSHHEQHQDNQATATKTEKQFSENSWIIHQHVDFIKISVLSSIQASAILQQLPSKLCNRQVSLVSNSFNLTLCSRAKNSNTAHK